MRTGNLFLNYLSHHNSVPEDLILKKSKMKAIADEINNSKIEIYF